MLEKKFRQYCVLLASASFEVGAAWRDGRVLDISQTERADLEGIK